MACFAAGRHEWFEKASVAFCVCFGRFDQLRGTELLMGENTSSRECSRVLTRQNIFDQQRNKPQREQSAR